MKRIEYFTYVESVDNRGKFLILPKDYDALPFDTVCGGSYAVAPARVLGLSYAEYLRFVRDSYPNIVELHGKDSLYIRALWSLSNELLDFIKLLNMKLQYAIMASNLEEGENNNDFDLGMGATD